MPVSSLENTLQRSYEWLNELTEFGHFRDTNQAYSILRVVLHSIRDRLPVDLSLHFASQLPMLLGGVYINGWNPSSTARAKKIDDFIQEIYHEERNLEVNPKESLRSTLQFLRQKLDPGLIEKVIQSFPANFQKLWQIDEKQNQTKKAA